MLSDKTLKTDKYLLTSGVISSSKIKLIAFYDQLQRRPADSYHQTHSLHHPSWLQPRNYFNGKQACQQILICSKSTIEALEKGMKYVQS